MGQTANYGRLYGPERIAYEVVYDVIDNESLREMLSALDEDGKRNRPWQSSHLSLPESAPGPPADHGSVSIVGAGTGAASSAVLTGVTLPTVSGSMREEAAGEGGVGGGWFE